MASKKKKPTKKSKKSPGFNKKIIETVFELSRHMRASFTSRLKSLDLYGGQERIILLLAEKDGQAPGAIADKLGVSAPTIAKSINRLAARGILIRKKDKADGRRANVFLTEEGVSIVKKIRREHKIWRKELLDQYSENEKEVLLKNMQNMLHQIEKN